MFNYLCLSLRPQKLYTPCVLNCFFLRAKAKISMFFIVWNKKAQKGRLCEKQVFLHFLGDNTNVNLGKVKKDRE